MRTGLRHTFLSATTALALLGQPQIVLAEEARYTFELQAQDLATALRSYAKMTGQQVAFDGTVLRGKRSNPVIGSYTADEALQTLLRNTGLSARKAAQNVLIIEDPNQTASVEPIDQPMELAEGEIPAHEPETIVVTGSHIRGTTAPVGGQLIVIDRDEIDRSGFSSVRDIAEALPQNFGGGATGERQPGASSALNVSRGTTFNLRGLGNIATLVLLNSRRIPAGGIHGTTTDVSAIPLAAIERVEVLPDGASAVYGSDAVAGVVNFILRRDFDGFESRARYGTVTAGKLDEYSASQSAGKIWSGGNALIIYEFFKRRRLLASERSYTANSDFRWIGGQDRRPLFNNPGNIVDPATGNIIYTIPPNQTGRNLAVTDLLPANLENRNSDISQFIDLFPEQRQHSLFGIINQAITANVELHLEGRYSQRKTNSWNGVAAHTLAVTRTNPFYIDVHGNGTPIYVNYSFHKDGGINRSVGTTENYGGTAGATINHKKEWQTHIYYSFGSESFYDKLVKSLDFAALQQALANSDPESAFNPFGDGSSTNANVLKNLFKDRNLRRIHSKVHQSQIITNGPLFNLLGNSVKAALGADFRREQFSHQLNRTFSLERQSLNRDVLAIFGELNLPLVSGANSIPGVYRLALTVSARHERYKDKALAPFPQSRKVQSSTDPRLGLSWSPVSAVSFKSSYGTSFRAPTLHTLTTTTSVESMLYDDPASQSGLTYLLSISGADPNLRHETAKTWTLGADVSLPLTFKPKMQISYFYIAFKDQVTTPQQRLDDPALAPRIIRAPTLAQIRDTCALAKPENLFVNPDDCTTPGLVQAIVDIRARNYTRTTVDGIDITFNSSIETDSYGSFDIGANATYLLNYNQQFSPASLPTDLLNRPLYPVDLRMRTNFTWRPTNRIAFSTFMNYTRDYFDKANLRKVGSWTTLDATFAYSFRADVNSDLLKGVSLQVSATNILGNNPPFQENSSGFGYDPANADPMGRFLAVTLTKRW